MRWLAGYAGLREELLDALGELDTRAVLLRARSPRRLHWRLELASGERLFLKHCVRGAGRKPAAEAAAAALGLAAAQREWRALMRLTRLGVCVPEPRALVRLPRGDLVLATAWLDGRPLLDGLPPAAALRRPLLAELGRLLRRLHAAGLVHGDLHAGNVLVTPGGPALLDLQAARPGRTRRAHLRDLGALDHSLAARLSAADRLRLRGAALGLARPYTPAAKRALRAVGRASEARRRAHAASRTRRALVPGRRFAVLCGDGHRGLRARELDESVALAALREARGARGDALLKSDARSRVAAVRAGGRALVVKEFRASPGRRLADVWRGSPARRAWRGGHGLRARGVGVASPLAFWERRVLGIPVTSAVVLEDVRPARPADEWDAALASPGELADALARLALRLHRAQVVHGDLKASHVFVARHRGVLTTRLVDLEGVRFPRRIADAARLRALAELNASLPDRLPAGERYRAFARYASALPFRSGNGAALRALVAASLARGHRWTAPDCALARAAAPRATGGRREATP